MTTHLVIGWGCLASTQDLWIELKEMGEFGKSGGSGGKGMEEEDRTERAYREEWGGRKE